MDRRKFLKTAAAATVVTSLSDKVALGTDFPSIPYDYATQLRAIAGWASQDDRLRTKSGSPTSATECSRPGPLPNAGSPNPCSRLWSRPK